MLRCLVVQKAVLAIVVVAYKRMDSWVSLCSSACPGVVSALASRVPSVLRISLMVKVFSISISAFLFLAS